MSDVVDDLVLRTERMISQNETALEEYEPVEYQEPVSAPEVPDVKELFG